MAEEIVDRQDTKIVATVGPASDSKEMLQKLILEGVDIFRLNFSHGTHEGHAQVIDRIIELNNELDAHVGILADLQGPKLRIGNVEEGVVLEPGKEIEFTSEPVMGNADRVYMNYERFPLDVKAGERVLVNDGKIVLEVLSSDGKSSVRLKVLFGGPLSSNKGVNLPETKITQPALTEKDLKDLSFILTKPVNWIALSFVRKKADVKDLIGRIEAAGHPAKVIAKIEKPEAIENIDGIIKVANGIMIARGDLGVEVPIERLPSLQKMIIKKCLARARPVIVATQMMESMIHNPTPTRAEVTDVANAVLDGTDAVMLSQETAVGDHPELVVREMNKIIFEAEKNYEIRYLYHSTSKKSETWRSDVVCFNSARMSQDLNAAAIVGMTYSGYTAFKISCCRPSANIYIFSENKHILATLNLVWGVRCFYYDKFTSTDETIQDVNKILIAKGKIKEGDIVINTGSMPIHKRYRTNMMRATLID